jgi:hypothetical protein
VHQGWQPLHAVAVKLACLQLPQVTYASTWSCIPASSAALWQRFAPLLRQLQQPLLQATAWAAQSLEHSCCVVVQLQLLLPLAVVQALQLMP